ncbi:MAG: pantoate--beta-alanine ligase [Bacteroidetes bacterium]|nr:pantoate--beta-alanine ligase [Bacteroidota bacterium]
MAALYAQELQIFYNASSLQVALNQFRAQKKTIGFVPTMGALHNGHLFLVEKCAQVCDITIVSIFVNPTQFNDKGDFERYPRNNESDLAILENSSCNMVYLPTVSELYPNGIDQILDFDIPHITSILEGKHRPGFLQGVVTVVMSLFENVKPTHAFFGLKDYQQYLMVKGASAHYNKGVEVVGLETQRNQGGLALSSRNQLLTQEERVKAEVLYAQMNALKQHKGDDNLNQLLAAAFNEINNAGLKAEYFELRNPETLNNVEQWTKNENYLVLCAAKLGNVRLMDNLLI